MYLRQEAQCFSAPAILGLRNRCRRTMVAAAPAKPFRASDRLNLPEGKIGFDRPAEATEIEPFLRSQHHQGQSAVFGDSNRAASRVPSCFEIIDSARAGGSSRPPPRASLQ